MEIISKEEIERIDEFAKFCKKKSLRIIFRPNGTFRVEQSND